MELKIYNPQDDGFVQKIDWNFAELKNEVAAAADSYALSVYTDDTIKQAKADPVSYTHLDVYKRQGFDKVPDASKITRFKQDFLPELEDVFSRLVDLTEPICQAMDIPLLDFIRMGKQEVGALIRARAAAHATKK